MRVAGVDGTRGGWIAIVLENGSFAEDLLLRHIENDFQALASCGVVAIDVPIGFGPRRTADRAARERLKGRAKSCVFETPSREVLGRPFGPGLGVSAQAHALGPRILHVTALVAGLAANDRRFHEVHPEVSFQAMNDEQALRHRKKSTGGALERLALLRRHGIHLDRLGDAASVPLDDVLDAAAAAWTARRLALGHARSLPESPEVADDVRSTIWY
jgi:predicted RNase H-like nuclease